MPRIQLPISSYQLRSPPASPARIVNCFPEGLPPDASYPVYLARAPGIKAWATAGSGPIIAMHEALDSLYVVSGRELYLVDSNGSATLLGDIGPPGNVDIDSNFDTVVVVNEPDGFTWDTGTSTFAQITDVDFTDRGAGDVEFLDNFLLFREPDSGRMFGTGLGTVAFAALDFVTAEGSPDLLNGMKTDHRQILLFGNRTIESYENTGVAGFPFEPCISGLIELGCANGKTVANLDNTLFWLASDFTVRRLEGITPVRISTYGIEQKIAKASIATGFAFSYTMDGHLFYVLSFSSGTFIWDQTASTWHERQSSGLDNWRVGSYSTAFNLQLVGDSTSNKIGILDFDTYDEWSDTVIMEWTYQPIYAEGSSAFHDRLEIILETGVGLPTGQGSDPEMMMEYSDDGGLTFDFLPTKKIGKIGKTRARVQWNALGSSRERVYRGSVSDPVAITITDTIIEARGGRL